MIHLIFMITMMR